jgi:hypothetical protein
MKVRDEDSEWTLIFVDMLGFAALTEVYKTRVIDHAPDERGFEGSSTSPIQNRINSFYRVIDSMVLDQSLYGLERAMLFSDCAFIVADNPAFAALIATKLMRELIKNYVPVRMGLGNGTFYPLGMSTDLGDAVVSRSRFIGTSVVRAHAAEQCGGKGMRIFVDSSLDSDRSRIEGTAPMLELPKRFNKVAWELNFLYPQRPTQEQPATDEADKDLFKAVAEMRNPDASARIKRQYHDTLAAMNRMRKAHSRTPVKLRNVRYRVDGPWS